MLTQTQTGSTHNQFHNSVSAVEAKKGENINVPPFPDAPPPYWGTLWPLVERSINIGFREGHKDGAKKHMT